MLKKKLVVFTAPLESIKLDVTGTLTTLNIS
jgi:hypothetical protein